MATEAVAMAYPPGAVECAMKAHEVIMRALDGQLTWIQAAEILGRSPRSIRRLRWLLQHRGYDGLFDRRRRTPSPKRAPVAEVQRLLALYRDLYQGFNVRHFHQLARRPRLPSSSSPRVGRRDQSPIGEAAVRPHNLPACTWPYGLASWGRRDPGESGPPLRDATGGAYSHGTRSPSSPHS
jgi:hypothetical protein